MTPLKFISTALARFAKVKCIATPPHTVLFALAEENGMCVQIDNWTPATWSEDAYWDVVDAGELDAEDIMVTFQHKITAELEWTDERLLTIIKEPV